MKKATDSLLSDHKMIRKLLENWQPDNPRYREISKTLERVVLTHAWFEDVVFLPAFQNEPLLVKKYLDELYEEHKDIDYFLNLIRKTVGPKELSAATKQFRAILENHLRKEEDALFPLAEIVLDNDGLNNLSAEMEKRQSEAQKLFNP
jgi:iron-sulfur cluster repair protein YtfE (RIC family)